MTTGSGATQQSGITSFSACARSAVAAASLACPTAAMWSGGCRAARWRAEGRGIVVLGPAQSAKNDGPAPPAGRGGSSEPKDRRSARQRAASDTLTMQGCRQGACGAERQAGAVLQAWHGLGGSGLGGERSGGS